MPTLQRSVSSAIAGLVLLQAVAAGQSERLFGSWGIALHGGLGNLTFVLVLLDLGLALRAGRRGRMLLPQVVLVVLVVLQMGLGYAGREAAAAAAWHVPLGVSIFGLAVWNLADRDAAARVRIGRRD